MEVLDVVGEYLVGVRRSGPSNIVALCPFHHDTRPSFWMSTVTSQYICFACGAKGNLRVFLREMGMTDTVINRKYGVLMKDLSKRQPKPRDPTKPSIKEEDPIPESLLGLFYECPLALLEEGFEETTLKTFEVGFDKWHQRITYPLRDLYGNLVGMSGRTLSIQEEHEYGKYKVYTDEYEVWDLPPRRPERNLLWNAHSVYPIAYFGRTVEKLVLVEGFKACMWVHQSGIPTVVALLGSSMSWTQRWIIHRMGAPVYIMLDNNSAGRRGTMRIGEDLSMTLPVRVVLYDAEQPDGLPSTEVVTEVNRAKDFFKVRLDRDLEKE
jgi:DNA primase